MTTPHSQYKVLFRNGHSEFVLAPDQYTAIGKATEASGQHRDDVKNIDLVTTPPSLAAILLRGQMLVLIAVGAIAGISALLDYWHPVPFTIATAFMLGLTMLILLWDDIAQARKARRDRGQK